ncbi:MAG: glycosyltransferase family 39 protein [Maribacter sp.]|nr:glycosyltransferase family 39 protein [Maribacter sp.]
MLKSLINLVVQNHSNLKNRTAFLYIFCVSFFLRLPFFFRDYIDRDESTFILMGQSWVDGNLPYTELWDLKPPITFLFFAGVIYVFGKSFIAIRLFGTLLVAQTAFFTYKIGEETDSKKTGFWSAIICVVLLTLFGSLQGVMSEHICMAFFMPGLYLLIRSNKPLWYLVSGLLMGIAVMAKMNIAYAILFLGIFIMYRNVSNKKWALGLINFMLFGFGVLLVILSTFLPYYLNGNPEVWWKSVVLAPLEYVGARRESILNLAPIFAFLAVFFFFVWKKNLVDFKKTSAQFLLVAILGILYAFYKGGRINGHYLIQLHPILVVLVVIVLGKIHFFRQLTWKPYYLVFLFLIPMESYLEYANVIKNRMERGTFFNGEGISVPKYIRENSLNTHNILFLGYHIGYWALDATPPTKSATHPSNICREELFPFYGNPRRSSIEELQYIMETIQPKTIITRKNRLVFDKKQTKENEYIDAYLIEHYKVHATVEKANILQRLK